MVESRQQRAGTLPLLRDLSDPASFANTLTDLLALAVALGARQVDAWSFKELQLVEHLPTPAETMVAAVKTQILAGEDPLGDAYCRLLSATERRPYGATYTPAQFVSVMTAWAASQITPKRVIDPGCGSGRFSVAAGRCFQQAALIGIETEPVAAILARANLAVTGFANRATVRLTDYRHAAFEEIDGATLFIGNPPYVRHHDIAPEHK